MLLVVLAAVGGFAAIVFAVIIAVRFLRFRKGHREPEAVLEDVDEEGLGEGKQLLSLEHVRQRAAPRYDMLSRVQVSASLHSIVLDNAPNPTPLPRRLLATYTGTTTTSIAVELVAAPVCHQSLLHLAGAARLPIVMDLLSRLGKHPLAVPFIFADVDPPPPPPATAPPVLFAALPLVERGTLAEKRPPSDPRTVRRAASMLLRAALFWELHNAPIPRLSGGDFVLTPLGPRLSCLSSFAADPLVLPRDPADDGPVHAVLAALVALASGAVYDDTLPGELAAAAASPPAGLDSTAAAAAVAAMRLPKATAAAHSALIDFIGAAAAAVAGGATTQEVFEGRDFVSKAPFRMDELICPKCVHPDRISRTISELSVPIPRLRDFCGEMVALATLRAPLRALELGGGSASSPPPKASASSAASSDSNPGAWAVWGKPKDRLHKVCMYAFTGVACR